LSRHQERQHLHHHAVKPRHSLQRNVYRHGERGQRDNIPGHNDINASQQRRTIGAKPVASDKGERRKETTRYTTVWNKQQCVQRCNGMRTAMLGTYSTIRTTQHTTTYMDRPHPNGDITAARLIVADCYLEDVLILGDCESGKLFREP